MYMRLLFHAFRWPFSFPIHFDVYSRLSHLKCAKRADQESIIILSILAAYRTRYSAFPSSCDSRETSERTSFQIQTETGEAEKQTDSGNQANCCHGAQRESGECVENSTIDGGESFVDVYTSMVSVVFPKNWI